MASDQGFEERHGPTRRKRIPIWVPLVVIAGAIVTLLTVGLAIAGIFVFALFPGPSNDLVNTSTSPDGHWTVRAYSHDPGAMASDWITVDVKDNTGKQPAWQIAHLDDLSDSRLWTGNNLHIVWKTKATVAIGPHDYGVVKPWWKTRQPSVSSLIIPFLAAAAAIGYWCYRIWRRKGRRRWLGLLFGFLVSFVATPFVGLACVPISYALPDLNAGPGARSHVLIGALMAAGIITTFVIATQVVLVSG